jgi:hypothetical protein
LKLLLLKSNHLLTSTCLITHSDASTKMKGGYNKKTVISINSRLVVVEVFSQSYVLCKNHFIISLLCLGGRERERERVACHQ